MRQYSNEAPKVKGQPYPAIRGTSLAKAVLIKQHLARRQIVSGGKEAEEVIGALDERLDVETLHMPHAGHAEWIKSVVLAHVAINTFILLIYNNDHYCCIF